jgi:hypothetical protein
MYVWRIDCAAFYNFSIETVLSFFRKKNIFNLLLLFSDKHITDEFKLQPGASIHLLYLVIIATMTEVLW